VLSAHSRASARSPTKVFDGRFEAMTRFAHHSATSQENKLQTTIANVTPAAVLVEKHRK
jgi:hypothetical protein